MVCQIMNGKMEDKKSSETTFFQSYFKNMIGREGGTFGEGGPANQLKKCQIKYLKNYMFANEWIEKT